VIIVSTIGYVGYFLSKKFGQRMGLWLSGVLGGIVSSTAFSVSAGRLAQRTPADSASALQASVLASAIMYLRILVLIWILNPAFAIALWWKLVLLAIVGVVLALGLKPPAGPREAREPLSLHNPFEIMPAIVFAVLFVVLGVVTILVRRVLGDAGTLTLSAIVGFTDVDPYILSVVHGAVTDIALGVKAVVLATMSNTVAKGVYFGVLAPSVRKETWWRYALWAVLHIPLLFV
jgi:uncharacterized membrane protein (DUF4010 family)